MSHAHRRSRYSGSVSRHVFSTCHIWILFSDFPPTSLWTLRYLCYLGHIKNLVVVDDDDIYSDDVTVSVQVAVYMTVSWLVPVCGGCLPLLCLLVVYHYSSCHEFLGLQTIDAALSVCMNISVSIVAVIYLTVCALCCRIYFEVSHSVNQYFASIADIICSYRYFVILCFYVHCEVLFYYLILSSFYILSMFYCILIVLLYAS